MTYTESLIKREIEIIESCLKDWELTSHPEARKERDSRLADLNRVLKLIEENH